MLDRKANRFIRVGGSCIGTAVAEGTFQIASRMLVSSLMYIARADDADAEGACGFLKVRELY